MGSTKHVFAFVGWLVTFSVSVSATMATAERGEWWYTAGFTALAIGSAFGAHWQAEYLEKRFGLVID